MGLNVMSHFDRARRTVYVEHRALPRRIGAVEVSKQDETLEVTLPFSKVTTPDGSVYYEPNHALVKINSAGDLADLLFIRPMWAEVEEVIQGGLTVDDALNSVSSGTTRPMPETLVLHKFGWS